MNGNVSAEQVAYFVSVATGLGIPAQEAPALFERHMTWCDANGKDYGGKAWRSLCELEVKEIKERLSLSDKEARLAAENALRRENERIAKEQADAEYAKTAISLPEWLADLRVKPDFSEELTPIEAHIVRYREPWPGEDSAAWLMAALADYRGPIAECHKRRRRV